MRRLAIDFGTSNTVAALAADGQAPRTVTFGPSSLLPSAVYAGPDGITVGREAQRQARLDPSRFEPNPKRRIDDGEVLLGDQVIPVVELIAAVLRSVSLEVRRQFGGAAVDEVRLTHPAQWGSTRRNTLLTAARMAGLGNSIELIAEPVAAAAQFTQLPGRELRDGQAVAIYDLGGGTFDVAVVGRNRGDFAVLAEAGLSDLGGLDFDQAILDLIGRSASAGDPARWQAIARPTDGGTRRAARALAEDVRAAKETLSDYQQTEVALPDPFVDVHLTRSEFEGLVRPNLMRSVEVLDQTLRNAGVAPSILSGIFLVGGSSRIPLVARLIQERFNIIPVALDQPETAVALGALAVPRVVGDLRTTAGGPPPGFGPPSPGFGAPQPPGLPPQPAPGFGQPQPPPGRPSFEPAAVYPPAPHPGYQPPAWAGQRPPRSKKVVIGGAIAAVIVVVLLVLVIAKPFSSSGHVAATTTPLVRPVVSSSPSVVSSAPVSSGGVGTGTAVPTTLTGAETTFLGTGFRTTQCELPTGSTGADSTGPVTIGREVLCEVTSDLTGGTVYVFVLSVADSGDVDTYLDYLAGSRGVVTGSTPDEDTSYSQNGISGRVLSAEKLPISKVDHPAVAWSESGQNFVGVVAATGSITVGDLASYWTDSVAN